ncbi:hypothetical protein BH10ACT9_BH10ACT9_55310 [soil metagenome]
MLRHVPGAAAVAAAAALCAAPAGAEGLVGFTSPSGNIGCFIDVDYVRCDIAERSWTPPARPADCEFDYGQGIAFAAGEAPAFVCAGDTSLWAGPALAFGESLSAGSMSCQSLETGITCRDDSTGTGFTISREEYSLF